VTSMPRNTRHRPPPHCSGSPTPDPRRRSG
jgi:hypothetical protein